MDAVKKAIVALLLCLLGAALNCTWPLFSMDDSPKAIKIISPEGWQWENVWLFFIFGNIVLNAALCLGVVGPSTLLAVYRAASAHDITLVCVASFFWGSGTAGYGLGLKMVGVGPGTALVMSLLVVIGTLLPLIENNFDDAGSPAALVTVLGLIFAVSGFVTSAFSSILKVERRMPLCGCIFSAVDRRAEDHFVNQGNGTLKGLELRCDQTTNVPEDCSCPSGTSETASSKDGQHDNGSCASNNGHASETQQNGDFESQRESKGTEEIRTNLKEGGDKHGRYILGVAVCILGAVTSSLLQFVFVYGRELPNNTVNRLVPSDLQSEYSNMREPLIDCAKKEGLSNVTSPLVIWLLAFSFSGMWNVMYMCYLLTTNGTWGRFATTVSWRDLLWKLLRVTVMSLFFVVHIHFYGIAQALFGDLGPVVAWPLVMCATVLGGQVWSIFMKEWAGAPKVALRMNMVSISLIVTALIVIAVAGAVL